MFENFNLASFRRVIVWEFYIPKFKPIIVWILNYISFEVETWDFLITHVLFQFILKSRRSSFWRFLNYISIFIYYHGLVHFAKFVVHFYPICNFLFALSSCFTNFYSLFLSNCNLFVFLVIIFHQVCNHQKISSKNSKTIY